VILIVIGIALLGLALIPLTVIGLGILGTLFINGAELEKDN
jgi:hypothetical protein